ncbi:MAG: excinuclease ABC subunit UvrA [Sandaracinaceae bacterium]
MTKELVIRGARQHNLKDLDVDIPRDRMTVITGPSGSGKSSLAFDTIYAEGQRRYVESLSVYARRFLDQMPKPDVDLIDGLSPAIAIEQKTTSRNPRSTVGTVTEIHDYLRLLFAKVGEVHCPRCARVVRALTVPEMVERVLAWPAGTRVVVQAPLPLAEDADVAAILSDLRKDGWVRVAVDGVVHDLGEDLDVEEAASVEVQVDRLALKPEARRRLAESLELALRLAEGRVHVVPRTRPSEPALETLVLSERFVCLEHGPVIDELTPQTFSFNSPSGACPTCSGLGEQRTFDAARIVTDPTLSIEKGAIVPWGKPGAAYHRAMTRALIEHVRVDLDKPWKKLTKATREKVLHGAPPKKGSTRAEWPGVIGTLEQRLRDYEARKRDQGETEAAVEYLEEELGRFASRAPCRECGGARLRQEALGVRVGDHDIATLTSMPLRRLKSALDALELDATRSTIADRLLRELRARSGFLVGVGLGYLSLGRPTKTLSGGESQRIRLATQIGSALVGVLYVLDEPSIGLHPRDHSRLLETLHGLRDAGNTVLVVEHDPLAIRAADHVIDMGPGAGLAGGQIIASGTPDEIEAHPESLTGRYLSGAAGIETPESRRRSERALRILDAETHNLRKVSADIPLGCLTCVTGVSGSGKSSLIVDTMLPLARHALHNAQVGSVAGRLEGLELIDKVIAIDQAPIGRTPRSNPATYSGVFAALRELFAALPDARARGWGPGRFSFNTKGGRCEACKGDGVIRVQMHFLPDVFVTCAHCHGRRYEAETLSVKYRGLSIADVLDLSVEAALEQLEVVPKIRDRLAALRSVGLGYVSLGQSATTLSGGEAQRLKLAKELARRATGDTLYVLDEPTTGLHASDVEVLMAALEDLVELGNTVLVIEHDLDVVRCADHVIDLGPDGGDGGGEVLIAGTPEQVAGCEASVTGRYLREVL